MLIAYSEGRFLSNFLSNDKLNKLNYSSIYQFMNEAREVLNIIYTREIII